MHDVAGLEEVDQGAGPEFGLDDEDVEDNEEEK